MLAVFRIVPVAAAVAEGETHITGAARLRLKESDRLAATADGPSRLGAQVEERPDGLYTLRYGEIQIMAIAKIQQMAEEIAKLKEQVAALSAGKE